MLEGRGGGEVRPQWPLKKGLFCGFPYSSVILFFTKKCVDQVSCVDYILMFHDTTMLQQTLSKDNRGEFTIPLFPHKTASSNRNFHGVYLIFIHERSACISRRYNRLYYRNTIYEASFKDQKQLDSFLWGRFFGMLFIHDSSLFLLSLYVFMHFISLQK